MAIIRNVRGGTVGLNEEDRLMIARLLVKAGYAVKIGYRTIPGNAKGKKGHGGTGPPGNKNAVKTGEFETLFFDTLNPEELQLAETIGLDKEQLLLQEIQLLTCIFEPAMSMIDAYNKAISEKANDVDYFADAYMKILGAALGDDEMKYIRDNRIINFDGDADQLVVDFLQKPNGDTTQEHLIDRLEKLIFQISMVANISDENFGTSSGIAMKYKLQGMSNLAKTKERKFTSGMNRRYKLIFSNPVSGMKEDDWVKLHYHFTPNIPSNVLEESQIAGNLEGIVSQETQLGVLSVVDNVQNEMKKIENEQEKAKTDPVMMQMFGGAGDGKSGVLEEPGNGSKET